MADQGAKGGDRKEKKRPTIRDLDPNAQVRKPVERVDPMAELIKKYGKKEDQKKTESDEDFDDGIRVPGVIPAQVKPLSSDVPTALLPRHQVVLQELINGRGSTRTASFPWKQLGDAGAMELAKVLSSGTGKSLEALDVSCNQIGSRGAIQIANTAGALPALETLNLGANGIGDEGAQAVAAAIVASESITFLDLHACAIGDKGWPTRSILAVSYRPTRSTLAAAYRPTRSTLAAVYKPTRHDRAILIRVGA